MSYKRANNAGILLSKIRRRFPDDDSCLEVVMRSLIYLTPDHITFNQITNFMSLLPLSDEEVKSIKEYQGQIEELIFPDKFFVQTLYIPRLYNRLRSEQIKRNAKRTLKNIKHKCIIRQNVCVELKESQRFRELLRAVLKYGNILNNGRTGINTIGFKLESLSQLKETRANKGGNENIYSLLDYIVYKLGKFDRGCVGVRVCWCGCVSV